MRIKFFGAAGEVTGSCYLVETDRSKILVDLGMFQGQGAERKNPVVPDLPKLDGVILTHAHLDHCGRLPIINGSPNIWMTPPTVELTHLVLQDAAHLMEGEVKRGQIASLYSPARVTEIASCFREIGYEKSQQINEEVSFKFLDAGHILGSASVEMEIKSANGGRKTIVFSGDLGNEPSPIVGLVDEPRQADVVVMESTYGDRRHEPRGKEEVVIEELVGEIEKNRGTLLIPAFSLERTQELLQIFDKLKKSGGVEDRLQVYLDTPMGVRATAIYEKYPEYFNEKMKTIFAKDDPFDFPGLNITQHHDQSERIDDDNGAKVIIAGSGMMSGGRIVHHAARWLPDKKTILLFTGFQAKGTRGRLIQDGDKRLVIEGKLVEVNARVEKIDTMSGHADQQQLMEWLKQISGIKKVILSHGEDEARHVLSERISTEMKLPVVMPYLNDVVEI